MSLERVTFEVTGSDQDLKDALSAASLVQAAKRDGMSAPRDLISAALADYGRLLGALYAQGHYSGVIQIQIDGTEAASLPLLNVPDRIGTISIRVDPGPQFRFGQTRLAPLPPTTKLPTSFATGQPARAGAIREAVDVAVSDWRDLGYAKTNPAAQKIVADHRAQTLSADVTLNTGPKLRFGTLKQTTSSAVRSDRINKIAGLPTGDVFSPNTLETVAKRLRRTGAFSSVALKEADQLSANDTLDIELSVADQAPRRFGFGAEVSSLEGLNISGFWMHRNIFGGAERLRFDAEVNQINSGGNAIDYKVSGRLEIPASFGPDTTGFIFGELEHLDEPLFTSDTATVNLGATWFASDRLEVEAGLGLLVSETTDNIGTRQFTLLTLPISATWDQRDVPLNPVNGYYIEADVTPFVGLDGTASGARLHLDARGYRGIGANENVVLAGRFQLGSVAGAGNTAVHPDFLFSSGGGDTVRGQPYQSLDVDLGGGVQIGGRSFIGVSTEVRTDITDKIGAVAFADAGYIGAESFFDGSGAWHSGAGLGLRYETGIGPIRFDVAAPVSSDTSAGVQIYIGIGQAF